MVIGEEIWKHAAKKSMDKTRAALASVVALREQCMIEVESDRGDHFRFWMWPLNEPEIAVCVLALRIPGGTRAAHGPRAGMSPLPGTRDVDP